MRITRDNIANLLDWLKDNHAFTEALEKRASDWAEAKSSQEYYRGQEENYWVAIARENLEKELEQYHTFLTNFYDFIHGDYVTRTKHETGLLEPDEHAEGSESSNSEAEGSRVGP